jgi:SAM-dependent methyltransferase
VKCWPIYLALQNAYAYGAGTGDASPNAEETNEIAAIYVARLRQKRELPRSLLIGPGGPSEVRALLGNVPEPVFVLSDHQPELGAIGQAGLAVTCERGDMHDMPFQSGVFGLVYASNVLEHALAPYVVLMEIRRVLAENGIAYLVMPSFAGVEGGRGPFHLHCLTQEVWTELLRKCGLVIADVHVQQGLDDSTAHYVHYRCVAGRPPPPHDRVLEECITCKASP